MQKVWVLSLAPKKFWRMELTPLRSLTYFPLKPLTEIQVLTSASIQDFGVINKA